MKDTLKSERGFFTIACAHYREEHATTANAALNKAVKMCRKYDGAYPVTILVDRGHGRSTSKVFHYGVVEMIDRVSSEIKFTPDREVVRQ